MSLWTCWIDLTPEEMNRLVAHGSHGVEGFRSSGWNFVVSLAEVMGLVAGYAKHRGEVAYRVRPRHGGK
jgi:hypothetical protein